MPSTIAPADALYARLAPFDPDVLSPGARALALDCFFALPTGRGRPGRYWRIDLETVAPDSESIAGAAGTVAIENTCARATACDLSTAARLHAPLLARAFGRTGTSATKFGALTTAFAQLGAFVYLPADVAAADPIFVTYDIPAGATAFPYTVVLAEPGARATVVERFGGDAAFVCGAAEVVLEAGADVSFAVSQHLGDRARFVQTRAARPSRDAKIAWACADLGSELSVVDLTIEIAGPGVSARVVGIFFPNGSQHVDAVATIDHAFGDSDSETLVKSAAAGRGQARFLGNIRIVPKAQGSYATLRDDALLLSKLAHVDSVPALEIAANDVKAYHGATVGAIDAEQIFYMESRGLDRSAAERMIALGFFEPAIASFPTDALRGEIRTALEAKLA